MKSRDFYHRYREQGQEEVERNEELIKVKDYQRL